MDLDEVAVRAAGWSGTLLPAGYLAHAFSEDAQRLGHPAVDQTLVGHTQRAWSRAQARTGPATGGRALFDLAAAPLFRALGFDAVPQRFDRQSGEIVLTTPDHTAVALLLLPWATAPSSAWRDAWQLSRSIGACWSFVLAPPFLSLLFTGGLSARQSVDFDLRVVIETTGGHPFWRLVQAAAFERRDDGVFLTTIVERSSAFQDRVKTDLRHGVATAWETLTGVIGGRLRSNSAREQALALIYRVMFMLFAESRELVPVGHRIYDAAYAIGPLCRHALDGHTRGTWDALGAVTRLARFGSRAPSLSMAPFGGQLFARARAPALERPLPARRSRVANGTDEEAASALVALTTRTTRGGRQSISYRDLGVEQLGAVYERLLDRPSRPPGEPTLRKATGTFYTPQPLAELVVRRTLAPLVQASTADAILELRVVDPAMGSGACLIAACRYLAEAYELALIRDGRAAADDFDEVERANVRRLIAERCLAGVDRSETAVDLAKLSLWLTTLAHGKPLGFLDHRLRVGDSLLGAWPDDLKELRRTRRVSQPLPLFPDAGLDDVVGRAVGSLRSLLERRDETVADVRAKASLWQSLSATTAPLARWRAAASLWCARWFWPSATDVPSPAETRALIAAVTAGDPTLPAARVADRLGRCADVAAARAFFHWPLEFPDVFYTPTGTPKPDPGFDAVIGNPPWEMLRKDDQGEASRADIVRFVRQSGQYPSCQDGHLNLYQAFIDRSLRLARPGGRIGLVLPWGLASDDGAARLRQRLWSATAVDTVVGFDNAHGLFPIHRGVRFMALTTTVGRPAIETRGRFGVSTREQLEGLPDRDDTSVQAYPIRFTARRLERLTGPLMRIPDARRARHIALAETIADRFRRLGEPSEWNVSFGRELNATEVRHALGPHGLPVVEGKHLAPFLVDCTRARRIDRATAMRLGTNVAIDRPRLAYRDVSAVGNAISLIAAVVPSGCVTTHTVLCLKSPLSLERQHYLSAFFNSFAINFFVRLLMGGHLTTSLVEGLPIPPWSGSPLDREIAGAALALSQPSGVDPSIEPRLQAQVAYRLELRAADLEEVLSTFPLIPGDRRMRVLEAFGRLDVPLRHLD